MEDHKGEFDNESLPEASQRDKIFLKQISEGFYTANPQKLKPTKEIFVLYLNEMIKLKIYDQLDSGDTIFYRVSQ